MNFLKKYNPKIKKILSLKNSSLVLILIAAFVFLLFPPSVSAFGLLDLLNIGNIVGGAFAAPFTIIIGTSIAVIILLSVSFVWISGALLYIVTSDWFFSWGYTNNKVVEVGLDITKEFVNLALVVVLVFIAIGITLRLREYTVQKTLVRLVIIALLVNFAPIVVGLIVDTSNIVMNFFLVMVKDGVTNILSGIDIKMINSLALDIVKAFTGTLTTKASILTKGAVYAILSFVLGLALLLYAFIFLFRYIAIWILTILSPLAFVAWILPSTKKFWDMWWKQLIHWSVIGIPMAFFLYLAMHTYGELNAHFSKNLPLLPSLDNITKGVLNNIFPYCVVLAFAYLGFFIGLQTSAMGAKAILQGAKRGGKTGGKVIAQRGWQWTKQGAVATGRVAASTARTAARIGQKMRRTYQVARRAGVPRSQALGEAIWRRRPWRPAARKKAKRVAREAIRQAPATIARGTWAASKGVLSAVKDAALAGAAAALLKKKLKKRGLKRCPACGNTRVARSAKTCPTCGYDFE